MTRKQIWCAALALALLPLSRWFDDGAEQIHYRNKVAVLTYHHLNDAESDVTVSPERFASHLQALKRNGFHVIPMQQFIGFLQHREQVPPNAVVITFDDGYESVYRFAYPMLKAENMTATVFLIVGYVGRPGFLNWDQIAEMRRGGFEFYSHSYMSHETATVDGRSVTPLVGPLSDASGGRRETEAEYEARVLGDLTTADRILAAKLGNRVNLLCLPHGQYSSALLRIARRADIAYVFTGIKGFNTSHERLIKRINAGSPDVTAAKLVAELATGRWAGD